MFGALCILVPVTFQHDMFHWLGLGTAFAGDRRVDFGEFGVVVRCGTRQQLTNVRYSTSVCLLITTQHQIRLLSKNYIGIANVDLLYSRQQQL